MNTLVVPPSRRSFTSLHFLDASFLRRKLASVAFTLAILSSASGATYYIDYDAGNDSAAGTSATAPWKHCPGDKSGAGTAASSHLSPGDKVIFKGGVTYRGSISLKESGSAGNPITLDGNTDGQFGAGQATISGGESLAGLKPCASAAEAEGNPNFARIYTVALSGNPAWTDVNLVQAHEHVLHVAQDPNLPDPFFQEDYHFFHDPKVPIRDESTVRIAPVGMAENGARPLVAMIDGGKVSGVINNLAGGGLKITWPEAVTLASLGIAPQPNYTWPKDIEVYANGALVLKTALTEPNESSKKPVEQKFPLTAPTTTKEMEIKFITAQSTPTYGAIASLAAYDDSGRNVMATRRGFFLQDPKVLTQTDPRYWEGAILSLHVKPNTVIYSDVLSFDPARHELSVRPFTNEQYKTGTGYSIFNSLKVLDAPGEYVVKKTAGGSTLYVWPLPNVPMEMERSVRSLGIDLNGASHVLIKGLRLQQFAGNRDGSAIAATGANSTDIHLTDLKVRFNRSQVTGAIAIKSYTDVVVEKCDLIENAGHMKGIIVTRSKNVLVRNCKITRGSGTALDFYTCDNGAVLDCEIVGNKGMHANGLTFYVNCTNILVEGNRVSDGNVALTFEDGKGLIVRNNILQSGDGPAVGVWNDKPFTDIVVSNNVILADSPTSPSIFGGNEGTANLYVVNNIMTPPGGNIMQKGTFEKNIVLNDVMPMTAADLPGDNFFVSDRKLVFRDPAKDFQPAAGSPAIAKGKALSLAGRLDLRGAPRAQGQDIGAYSMVTSPVEAKRPLENSSLNGFTFPTLTAHALAGSEAHFPHLSAKPEITVPALSYSAQGGGEVLRRDAGGYFAKWDNQDQWIEWTFDAPAAGNYELCIAEASELPAQRSFQINSQPIPDLQSLNMSVSGNWKKFTNQYLKTAIKLQAGKNVLRVNNPNASALNFRELTFYRTQ